METGPQLEFWATMKGNLGFLMIPAFLILALYAFKKSELSRNALENSAASIGVFFLNSIVLVYFSQDVSAWMNRGYEALNVPNLDPTVWNSMPTIVVFFIALAAKDFVDYWNHRLMHRRWFWPVHAAHHTDTHVNALTSFRIHYLESVMMSLGYLAILTWMQIPEVFPMAFILWHLHNFYVHMDLEWDHGPFKYLIASPRFHRWHHADVPEAYGKNLANVMPIYDKLFGTYYNPHVCREQMGALTAGLSDKNPVAIFVYPILEWARLVRGIFEHDKTSDNAAPSKTSAPAPRVPAE